MRVQCKYRDPPRASQRTSRKRAGKHDAIVETEPDNGSSDLADRLFQLEQRVLTLEGQGLPKASESPAGQPASSSSLAATDVSHTILHGDHGRPLSSSVERHEWNPRTLDWRGPPGLAGFRKGVEEAFTALPSLISFISPPYIHTNSWDDSAEFYREQIDCGQDLHQDTNRLLELIPDTSQRTIRRLQQSFVENFLGWTPIFEPATMVAAVTRACQQAFPADETSTCLTMFIFALGAVTLDTAWHTPSIPAGLDYYAHASRFLERFSMLSGDITVFHCRILRATYLKLAMRPLQAWNAVAQAMQDCMHVLRAAPSSSLNETIGEEWIRSFWACSVIVE